MLQVAALTLLATIVIYTLHCLEFHALLFPVQLDAFVLTSPIQSPTKHLAVQPSMRQLQRRIPQRPAEPPLLVRDRRRLPRLAVVDGDLDLLHWAERTTEGVAPYEECVILVVDSHDRDDGGEEVCLERRDFGKPLCRVCRLLFLTPSD